MSRSEPSGDGGTKSDWAVVTDRPVLEGGRLTIPDSVRERHGVGEGDVVDIRIYKSYPSSDPIDVPEALIQSAHRVGIAQHRLDIHGIEVGDYVDLEIRDTGLDYSREDG